MTPTHLNKRRVLAVAAAGAAGAAAAYYVYKRWNWAPDEDKPSSSGAQWSGGDTLVNPRGSAATLQKDAEAHLQHHFDSIQDIADNTTIPSLLPALAAALNRAADVDSLLEKLRQSKDAGNGGAAQQPGQQAPLTGEQKVALWEELSIAAFTRAVGSLWLLPLLDLFVRVQLNILGRHLYLESALDSSSRKTGGPGAAAGGAGAAPPTLPRLSAPSQEQFLSYAEYLSREGAGALLGLVQSAVSSALRGVALAAPLDCDGLGRLLSDMLAGLTTSARAAGWDTFLLPPPAALAESLLAVRPDNRALAPQSHALLVDREAVEGMLAEVRRVVRSDRFHEALVACVRELSHDAVRKLCDRLADQPLPLAKLVPAVAAAGQDYLTPGAPFVSQLARMLEVHTLCATVYSCGPPL
ncbi:hypothetical protein N2152v2_009181 [Parachlorella kessleri]